MSRRLLMLNALLVVIGAGFAAYIVWELVRPPRGIEPPRARPGQVAPAAAPAPGQPPAAPGSYAAVASRNLFSPSRSEAPATTTAANTPSTVARPTLHGVVLRDGVPLAYLEDPVTKRVTGYRVGDAVAGGTLSTIAADRVVLARPDGSVDVRLHDPTKVRPPVGTPGQAPGQGQPPTPGAPPPATLAPGAQPPSQGQVTQPPQSLLPPGRRLPPNLLRRTPIPGDGSNQ